MPVGISLFDDADFPSSGPFLESLLAANCKFHIAELLKINQPADTISLGETGNCLGSVLVNSANQVIRNSDVKRASDPAR